ncbi:hypothetical protein CJJ23_03305 [Mycoplasmopsis agassizii]|uniref:P60-like lipoprotein n=1 Tax=Mycoplasmopsis agassizii TaxID=33922 RepID=A0A269TIA4_9BACT|nr:hypothetical protein [Mycoplasmopsis agassizii]PAK21212.1 hypothetical protein CJJ23_03305 [Mycoplasmopsis agassizii]
MAKKFNLKSFLKLSLPLVGLSAVAVSAVACGQVVDSAEKGEQDGTLGGAPVKAAVFNLYKETILANLYGIDSLQSNDTYLDDSTSEFYQDAYSAWLFYASTNILNNINWFQEQRSTWDTNGISSYNFKDTTNTINVDNNYQSANTFKTLFLNQTSTIRNDLVNYLLVKRYLLNQSLEDVKKSLTNYDTIMSDATAETDATKILYKAINVENTSDFFLMKYLLSDAKIVNQWKYTSTPPLSQITSGVIATVKSVADYNAIVTDSAQQLKTINTNFAVNGASSDNLAALFAYQGFVNFNETVTPAGDFSWTMDSLKARTASNGIVEGFQDLPSNVLYTQQQLTANAATASTDDVTEVTVMSETNGTTTVNATYAIKIAPLFNTTSETFTFTGTPWASNEQQRLITFWLNKIDSTLITKALTHYKALGYSVSTDIESLKKSIEGEEYYA